MKKRIYLVFFILIFSMIMVFASSGEKAINQKMHKISPRNFEQPTKKQLETLKVYETHKIESDSLLFNKNIKKFTNYSFNIYTYRTSLYRGSFMLWSRDVVEWQSNGTKIISSSGWQEVGYVFPNIAHAKGIVLIYKTSTFHKYRATKTIGAGVVTPWGDVKIYSQDVTDYVVVYANGDAEWY
ncbi:hypothetical protein Marpi_2110 [Marinitoga piezophila KA3]|uniref:Uncharacterized protein n=1 Tax=Marinitoga piezophila (strain DSM 14283 / JCM 11233 / KA3) TaxID=443254 RepID=H2J7J2_MARPK|nr:MULTISPECIES: hypothetical protein [Marinitoga]AEX86485.1 hypothetical protein Marpi_2110 [Marinitoga piezophila KA3]